MHNILIKTASVPGIMQVGANRTFFSQTGNTCMFKDRPLGRYCQASVAANSENFRPPERLEGENDN